MKKFILSCATIIMMMACTGTNSTKVSMNVVASCIAMAMFFGACIWFRELL